MKQPSLPAILSFIFLLTFISCYSDEKHKKPEQINSTQIDSPKTNDNTVISGEQIDGPANIRDAANGKIIFTLNNGVEISATDTINKWCQIGLLIDLSSEQYKMLSIEQGSILKVKGKVVGKTNEKINISGGAFRTTEGMSGELVGYTAYSNLKPNTIIENRLTQIINSDPSPSFSDFKKIISDFGFSNTKTTALVQFEEYQIDENWVDDPSPLLRILLLFDNKKLFGIIHSRKLLLNNSKIYKLDRGYNLTIVGNQEAKRIKELIESFNSFIKQVD